MLRPASIVTFERCYLGAWAIGLINTAINWNAMIATANANPAAASLGPSFAATVMIATVAVGTVISLLLWYFTARRGSVVAKWIVVIFFAVGLIAFLRGLAVSGVAVRTNAALVIVTLMLQGIAVVMLFRADAKSWFGERAGGPEA